MSDKRLLVHQSHGNMELLLNECMCREGIQMGRKCFVTGKTTKFGQNRSFAENKSKRTFKANLQKVRILVDGSPKRVYVSTKALKAGLVERV